MEDKISQKMMELGFTRYEARAYISLLQSYPATRYEISKNSAVPRSAIYDVIRRLESIGVVNAISTKPEKYIPLPPDQFTELLENRYKDKLENFYDSISSLQISLETENLWNITGYQNLIIKAREMINKAKKQIYLSAWGREIKELESELTQAVDRGVKVILFSFTELPNIGTMFSYGLSERELEKVWDRKMILVRDLEELIMGEVNKRYPRKAAWTYNRAIVMIAINHIVLDLTLYGLRLGVDVSDVVIESHPGELELLGRLLKEKFPDNPWLDIHAPKRHQHHFDPLSEALKSSNNNG